MAINKKSILFFFMLSTLVSSQLFAQIEDPEDVFKELYRLDGTWFMASDRGDRLESWVIRDDSTMEGRGMRIKIGSTDTVLLENLRIELRGSTITYFAKVRGQNAGQEIAFKMTENSYLNYLFENPKHDDPQKIRYIILDRRELQVTTEGQRNGRTVKSEFIFEREFNPASIQFRARAGVNVFNLVKIGDIGDAVPSFSPRPGWELGVTTVFQGAGGLLNFNVEAGLVGKFPHAVVPDFVSTQPIDSGRTFYRDLTYNQTWLTLSATPEIFFKRKSNFSFVFGGYFARLLINRVSGTEKPIRDVKVFNYNGDFKKNDFGAVLGLNWRKNLGKKDLDGMFGLRFNFGLTNIDNLFVKAPNKINVYNGRVGLAGISLAYSINLLKT